MVFYVALWEKGENTVMKNRDTSLDAVKGFAILLVFFGHCLVWNHMSDTDPYFYDFIKSVQMPLFMMVSGYLAGMGFCRRTLKETGRLLGKRAAAYLIPFFVWPLLLHPLHPVTQIKGILFQLDRGLWFLMTLFIVTAVTLIAQWFAFLVTGTDENSPVFGQFAVFSVLIAVFYVLFFIQGRTACTFLSPSLTLSYLPFYVAGYVWTAYVQRRCPWKIGERVAWALWGIAAVVFLGLVFLFDLQKSGGMGELLLQMFAGMAGSFVCFYGIYHIRDGKAKQFLSAIGTVTLELYIFQYAMHDAFVKIRGLGDAQYSFYCVRGIMTALVTFFIMWAVSIPAVWIIKKLPLLDALLFGHVKLLKKQHGK